jgi:integrase
MSLVEAREVAAHYRALLDDGIDPRMSQQTPSEWRRDLKRVALPAAAAEVADSPDSVQAHSIEFLVAEFKRRFVAVERENPDYVYRVLDNEVLPFWRGRDVRTITTREVIDFLDRIVARGSRTMANRAAGILRQLFLFGVHRVIVDSSPVQLLMRPGGREKPRTRVLSDGELRSFLLHYRWAARTRALVHMLKILLLTAARRGECAKQKKRAARQ